MLALQAALAATALAAGLTSTWSPCGFSMVETIGRPRVGPLVRAACCAAFAAGALAGGTITFGILALAGRAVHGTGGAAAVAAGVAVVLAAALGDARGARIVPQIRRQVPEPWRRALPLPVVGLLYGVLLGLGFTTYVLAFGVWALAATSFALGDLAAGAAIGIAFGAGRALPVAAMAPLVDRPAGIRALELMAERPSLLRGFRAAVAGLLVCSAFALAAVPAHAAAVPVTIGGTEPTVAGGLLAWDSATGGLLAREPGAPGDPHALGSGGLLRLPGRDPALGGSLLAFRSGGTVRVVRSADLTQVAEVAIPGVTALAVSDGWLVYRATRRNGGDRLAARALADPSRERVLADVRPPAQLGRPAIATSAVAFDVADRRSSRIVEVDLVTGRRRVLRQSRLEQLSNPAVEGGSLLYVRQSNLRQLLQLGPRRAGGRDTTLLRAPATALRDDGFEPGHSTVTLTPRAAPRSTRRFWATALGVRYAYLTVLPTRAGRPAILRVPLRRAWRAAADPWESLRRPLHLPAVAPGARCPVSRPARLAFSRYGVARGIGPGPAYPIGFAQPGSLLRFAYPPGPRGAFAGSEWSGQKVLWFVAPSYRGPVLVRGTRLDGPELVRFDFGTLPPAELRIRRGERGGYPPGHPLVGQRYRPSYTRLRAAGCYAYQVDGTTFSRVVVFRARVSRG